jgi:hypothetical protein
MMLGKLNFYLQKTETRSQTLTLYYIHEKIGNTLDT